MRESRNSRKCVNKLLKTFDLILLVALQTSNDVADITTPASHYRFPLLSSSGRLRRVLTKDVVPRLDRFASRTLVGDGSDLHVWIISGRAEKSRWEF